MITFAQTSQTYGKSLMQLNFINFVNEKIQILEEEDLETSKKWEIFVSIANDFQKYYDSLKPSILVKVLEEDNTVENQGDIKVLEYQKTLEKRIKSESSIGGNPAKDEEILLRVTFDPYTKSIISLQTIENEVLTEIERVFVEKQACTLLQKERNEELWHSLILGGDIAEIKEKNGNRNALSNQNDPQQVKNVKIQLTSLSKNDESLFSEVLKKNLVTINRIRDKLTFYTCAQ